MNNSNKNNAVNGGEQLDELVQKASKYLNTTPEQLKESAVNGSVQSIFSQMPPQQAQKLRQVLSDENAVKKLLSSQQAQAILRGLNKNE